MLLPYASYLRMYEPADQVAGEARAAGRVDRPGETVTAVTLAHEQEAVLAETVLRPLTGSSGPSGDGGYVLRRDGQSYVCPLDLTLRWWQAVDEFDEQLDPSTRSLFIDPVRRTQLEQDEASWRAVHASAAPHIRQATWGVPRTWFLLVAQEEREPYDLDGRPSVRFRTPVADARRRLTSAYATLNATIDDAELMAELTELGGWLGEFADECWLELDYAGAAGLLGPALEDDRSAYEITTAVRAIARRDFATAGERYRTFVERWRSVAALERAN